MLISVNDIRTVRQLAKNIDDSRVEIYIREAESLDLIPAIGVELYNKLDAITPADLLKAEGEVNSNPEASGDAVYAWRLLNGGIYQSHCESRQYAGLKKALCYLTYARFIVNHSASVTPFGVVSKIGDDSSPIGTSAIATMAAEAKKIGMEYLRQTTDYIGCSKINNKKRRKFISIGD